MILKYISIFFFGILVCLIIFGIVLPFFPNIIIMPGTRSQWAETIISLLSSIVALTIAIWGTRLRKIGEYNSNVVITGSLENIQENTVHLKQGQTRLRFENQGKNIAEDVEVYIDKIYDNGILRRDYIPVPLTWTHSGLFKRSFQENQYGYLDLCRRDNIEKSEEIPKLVLIAGNGIPTYQNIIEGDTILRLIIFQKQSKRITYKIYLNWVKDHPTVKVTKIIKII